ncbi:DUF7091 family protein [Halobellus salinisoli]|uniref:DUF7091 family protein n=1 Tax=Halobellus salinisoli TaxID=3108500 RepID=UPI003008665D
MDDRLEHILRQKLREAGRQYARARDAYRDGKNSTDSSSQDAVADALSRDDEGRVRLVCRRYAERRAVDVDDDGHPDCYEAGHPDCEGCVADIRDGIVESW